MKPATQLRAVVHLMRTLECGCRLSKMSSIEEPLGTSQPTKPWEMEVIQITIAKLDAAEASHVCASTAASNPA